jgi:hypothetical protein
MYWCTDAPADEAISLFAGLLANPDVPLSLSVAYGCCAAHTHAASSYLLTLLLMGAGDTKSASGDACNAFLRCMELVHLTGDAVLYSAAFGRFLILGMRGDAVSVSSCLRLRRLKLLPSARGVAGTRWGRGGGVPD